MPGIHHAQQPFDAPLLPEQVAIMRGLQERGYAPYNPGVAGMPKAWLIEELQSTAARIEARGKADNDYASRAIADALFDIASGFSAAACQAIQEAERLREMRA